MRLSNRLTTGEDRLGANLWTDNPDTVETGWTDNGDGSYTYDGTFRGAQYVTENGIHDPSKPVRMAFTISGRTQGSAGMVTGALLADKSANGSYVVEGVPTTGSGDTAIATANNFDGTISDVAVYQVTVA